MDMRTSLDTDKVVEELLHHLARYFHHKREVVDKGRNGNVEWVELALDKFSAIVGIPGLVEASATGRMARSAACIAAQVQGLPLEEVAPDQYDGIVVRGISAAEAIAGVGHDQAAIPNPKPALPPGVSHEPPLPEAPTVITTDERKPSGSPVRAKRGRGRPRKVQ